MILSSNSAPAMRLAPSPGETSPPAPSQGSPPHESHLKKLHQITQVLGVSDGLLVILHLGLVAWLCMSRLESSMLRWIFSDCCLARPDQVFTCT